MIRESELIRVTNVLKAQVGDANYLDVGPGTEEILATSKVLLEKALGRLEGEGYVLGTVFIDKVGKPGEKTKIEVLAPKGSTSTIIFNNRFKIKPVTGITPTNAKVLSRRRDIARLKKETVTLDDIARAVVEDVEAQNRELARLKKETVTLDEIARAVVEDVTK